LSILKIAKRYLIRDFGIPQPADTSRRGRPTALPGAWEETSAATMAPIFQTHPRIKWAGVIVLGLVLILVVAVALFDWNSLRPMVENRITAVTGRPAHIDGDLKVHIWSWNPTAQVNGIRLENPSWADRKLMFAAKRITISVSLSHLLRGNFVLPQVEVQDPEINLERDSKGRASWALGSKAGTPSKDKTPAKVPTIQRLMIENGKLRVVDQIRKLTFSGSLVAAEQAGKQDESAFKVHCTGTLNDKPFTLEANGGPLLNLEPHKPYSFDTHLTASDIDLQSHVTVPKPFDLRTLDVKFDVSGNDLADMFYLTGLALPNTPKYQLGASVHLSGTQFDITDLKGRLGTSDLSGGGEVQIAGARPKLTAKLTSENLNIADLAPTLGQNAPKASSLSASPAAGKPAKAKKQVPATPPGEADQAPLNQGHLLPDADLQVDRVRGMDADVTYTAAAVTASKVPMQKVHFHLVLDAGLLTIDPLSFVLDQGKFSGKVRIDARQDVPDTAIDMHIDDVNLAQFKSATMKQAPLDGTLLGRFEFHGTGASLHKFAASSNGTVSLVIPHGQINEAIAELTGINVVSGLGLLLAKDQKQADIRCGIVDFKGQNGRLNTTTVYVDTSTVLITGRGNIDLGSEDLDIALQGDPKKFRFGRLRTPIELHGTLLHPAVGVKAGKLAEQGAVAVVLGTLLTPVVSALAFVDPGLAKNKDCATVFSQADAGVQPQPGDQPQLQQGRPP
jgi:AsmA family protein